LCINVCEVCHHAAGLVCPNIRHDPHAIFVASFPRNQQPLCVVIWIAIYRIVAGWTKQHEVFDFVDVGLCHAVFMAGAILANATDMRVLRIVPLGSKSRVKVQQLVTLFASARRHAPKS
jgi:hypothetical protein